MASIASVIRGGSMTNRAIPISRRDGPNLRDYERIYFDVGSRGDDDGELDNNDALNVREGDDYADEGDELVDEEYAEDDIDDHNGMVHDKFGY